MKIAPYDDADFFESSAKMAAFLEACIHDSGGVTPFIARVLSLRHVPKGWPGSYARQDCRGKPV